MYRRGSGTCNLCTISCVFVCGLIACLVNMYPLVKLAFYAMEPAGKLIFGCKLYLGVLLALILTLLLNMIYTLYALRTSIEKYVEKSVHNLLFIHLLTLGSMFTALMLRYSDANSLNSASLMNEISTYNQDPTSAMALDYIQEKFQCCGAISYRDWSDVSKDCPYKCTNDSWRCNTPLSCKIQNLDSEVQNAVISLETGVNYPEGQPKEFIYTDGCLQELVNFQNSISFLILYYGTICISIQIFIIYFVLAMYPNLVIQIGFRKQLSQEDNYINNICQFNNEPKVTVA